MAEAHIAEVPMGECLFLPQKCSNSLFLMQTKINLDVLRLTPNAVIIISKCSSCHFRKKGEKNPGCSALLICFFFKAPNNSNPGLTPNNAAISSALPSFLAAGGQPAHFSLQTGWTVTPVPITAAPMGNALQLSPPPLTTFHHNISEFP